MPRGLWQRQVDQVDPGDDALAVDRDDDRVGVDAHPLLTNPLAVDGNPALGDQLLAVPARPQARCRQHLLQPDTTRVVRVR